MENSSPLMGGVPFHPTHDSPIQLPEEVHSRPRSRKILSLKLFGVISACLLVALVVVLYIVFSTTEQRKCDESNQCERLGNDTNYDESSCREALNHTICKVDDPKSNQINKYCCKPKLVVRVDTRVDTGVENRYPEPPGGKSGRDLLDLKKCGKSSKQRIAHGEIAEVFEFPWMALLGDKETKFHCGGSLIAESFVLTAAHCCRFTEVVRLGETDISKEIDCIYAQGEEDCAEPHQDIQVAKFIRHPLYSVSKKKNDIALVKLAQPAQLNDNVRPICLPLPEMLPEKIPLKMMVSGWGYTEFQNQTSNELRYANLPVVEPEECQRSIDQLQDVVTLDESQVCAGNAGDLKDNCRGDSGGPLQYFARKGMVIHGVVAWGLITCGTDSAPGVYTKVSHYLDWIIDNLK